MLKFFINLVAVIVRFYCVSCQRFFVVSSNPYPIFMPTEFQFLENLRQKYSLAKIGDDCAVLPKDSRRDLVVTTDLLVEDIDFRIEWSKPEFIGHKALAVSLSDVAAMGAKPVWSMISIGVPERIWQTDFVDEFYDGYYRLAKKFDVEIVGGDVSKTPDKIVIDSIAAGEVKKGQAVLRSGAKPGDFIFVTGALGGATAGLKLLERGVLYDQSASGWQKKLLLKQLAPVPQVHAAGDLSGKNRPSAMIDLSDGLSSDLAHICRESKVGAKIFAERIPFHKNLRSVAGTDEEKLDYALNGGEDFELLLTANPKKNFHLKKMVENGHFFEIGEVTANAEIIELVAGGRSLILEPNGFRHF
jgi:thiamine-monophosphate kinase